MLTGYFSSAHDLPNPRAYLRGFVDIPAVGVIGMTVEFLIDTGADRSIIGSSDASRMVRYFGVDLTRLQDGPPSGGIGGIVATKTAEVALAFGAFSKNMRMELLPPSPDARFAIPSLLGRDVLSHFALFIEERTDKVLLLEPAEADALGWNSAIARGGAYATIDARRAKTLRERFKMTQRFHSAKIGERSDETPALRAEGGVPKPIRAPSDDIMVQMQHFKEDTLFVNDNAREIRRLYPDQWVAVYDKQVIGADADLDRLLDDLKALGYPPGKSLIKRVETNPMNLIV